MLFGFFHSSLSSGCLWPHASLSPEPGRGGCLQHRQVLMLPAMHLAWDQRAASRPAAQVTPQATHAFPSLVNLHFLSKCVGSGASAPLPPRQELGLLLPLSSPLPGSRWPRSPAQASRLPARSLRAIQRKWQEDESPRGSSRCQGCSPQQDLCATLQEDLGDGHGEAGISGR